MNPTFERSRQLTLLAANEAGRIVDADARLTRQLNIADQVQQRYGQQDTNVVLAEAARTLHEVGPQLGEHARISGWVSISQLARRAGGGAGAQDARAAALEAQRELEALPDLGARCQYVLGVAEEVSHAQSDEQAVALLVKGGEWAKAIVDSGERRRARLAFAIALFNLDAYEGGVAALRNEGDATWSADTMLALASVNADETLPMASQSASLASLGGAEQVAAEVEPTPAAPAPAAPHDAVQALKGTRFGRSVGYDSVFRGASQSRAQRQR